MEKTNKTPLQWTTTKTTSAYPWFAQFEGVETFQAFVVVFETLLFVYRANRVGYTLRGDCYRVLKIVILIYR